MSTGIVRTSGFNDTTCQGMVSSSLNPSQLNSGSETSHHNHTSLVLGLLLGLGFSAVIGIVFVAWALRRRRQVQAEERHLQHYHMFIPRPWTMFKRTSRGAGAATQDDNEFNLLIRSTGSPFQPPTPSPEPDDQEKLLDDVSSARSTYNTSPPPSSSAPSDGKQQEVDAVQSRVQVGGSSQNPSTVPLVSPAPATPGESPPAARPDTDVNNLIRYSENNVLHPDDLPPPYENISAH